MTVFKIVQPFFKNKIMALVCAILVILCSISFRPIGFNFKEIKDFFFKKGTQRHKYRHKIVFERNVLENIFRSLFILFLHVISLYAIYGSL